MIHKNVKFLNLSQDQIAHLVKQLNRDIPKVEGSNPARVHELFTPMALLLI